MKAMILVGGLGTRLRPLTFSIPKPLLPVGEQPILGIIIEQLKKVGINEIILATGYQAELIHTFCGDGSRFGVTITYVHEHKPLGTAGPLWLARDHFQENEFFILMNGDILTKLDFGHFLDAGRKNNWDLTVGYTKYVYRSPFGVLSIVDGVVQGITEKPSQEYPISAGIYCLSSTALDFVPPETFFTMPDLIQKLIAAKRKIGAYQIQECWMGLEGVDHFDEALKELSKAPSAKVTTP